MFLARSRPWYPSCQVYRGASQGDLAPTKFIWSPRGSDSWKYSAPCGHRHSCSIVYVDRELVKRSKRVQAIEWKSRCWWSSRKWASRRKGLVSTACSRYQLQLTSQFIASSHGLFICSCQGRPEMDRGFMPICSTSYLGLGQKTCPFIYTRSSLSIGIPLDWHPKCVISNGLHSRRHPDGIQSGAGLKL